MKVRYLGCSNEQANWASCDDPRGVLEEGKEYEVYDVQVHSWHTKLILEGIVGAFNSVCFDMGEES